MNPRIAARRSTPPALRRVGRSRCPGPNERPIQPVRMPFHNTTRRALSRACAVAVCSLPDRIAVRSVKKRQGEARAARERK